MKLWYLPIENILPIFQDESSRFLGSSRILGERLQNDFDVGIFVAALFQDLS